VARLRLLHAIHDFLPRHLAGSEVYAFELVRALAPRHDVWVLAAEYDPAANHGALRWKMHDGVPVVELVNNWEFRSFDDTYASPRLNGQIAHVLDAVQPSVIHIHNLLNLSLDLPRLARERGIPCAATLHDYTMVCVAGGQRVHRAARHVCETIDPERCAVCFGESPFGAQLAAGRTAALTRGRMLLRAASALRQRMPVAAEALGARAPRVAVNADDIRRRLAYVRHVFDTIDLFVAPSARLADEYARLGIPAGRIVVSANGCAMPPVPRATRGAVLNIGYVGSIVWHKGIHVLIEAAKLLRGSFTLSIHGDPEVAPDYTRDLRQLAAGLPLTFAGPFERARLPDVYGSIDVLVVPSLWPENAPLVVQEAFVHGVPVIAADIGGLPEFVRDGVDGRLFEAGSAPALARVLQDLLDAPQRLTQLSAAVPSVRSMADDARAWEERYARLAGGAR
jgi:glycosyltransferase involved in cell wall biosynthesis